MTQEDRKWLFNLVFTIGLFIVLALQGNGSFYRERRDDLEEQFKV